MIQRVLSRTAPLVLGGALLLSGCQKDSRQYVEFEGYKVEPAVIQTIGKIKRALPREVLNVGDLDTRVFQLIDEYTGGDKTITSSDAMKYAEYAENLPASEIEKRISSLK